MNSLQTPGSHSAMGCRENSKSVCAVGQENTCLRALGACQFRYHSRV